MHLYFNSRHINSRHINSRHRLTAFILLLSLFLQSCDHRSNSSNIMEKEKDKEKEEDVSVRRSLQHAKLDFISKEDFDHLENQIRVCYKVDGFVSFEKLFNGIVNNVFLVKNGDDIISVIKYYPTASVAWAENNRVLTEEVRAQGFPIPKVDFVFPTSNGHPIVCMQYCKGTHQDLDNKKIAEVASWMAKLHLATLPNRIRTDVISMEDFNNLFEQTKDWEFTPVLRKILGSIDLDYLTKIPKGLIHADFSISNVIFDEEGHVAGIIDWDYLSNSYLLTDIVYAQVFYGFDADANLQEDKIIQFLHDYNLTRQLQPIELDNFYSHLKVLLIYAALNIYLMYEANYIDGERFNYSKSNNDVNPNILVKKLLNIQDKSSINISLN